MMTYNENNNCECVCECKCENPCGGRNQAREDMMMEIRQYKFAIIELSLYLDTHPEDQRALYLHNEYTRKAKELVDKYQKVYGPLTIDYPCNKWRWLEEPWVSFYLGAI